MSSASPRFWKSTASKPPYTAIADKACAAAFESANGVAYLLCSADHIGFAPRLIAQT